MPIVPTEVHTRIGAVSVIFFPSGFTCMVCACGNAVTSCYGPVLSTFMRVHMPCASACSPDLGGAA